MMPILTKIKRYWYWVDGFFAVVAAMLAMNGYQNNYSPEYVGFFIALMLVNTYGSHKKYVKYGSPVAKPTK
jgi:hypothetical protein